jgi:acyl-CoA synthetase (AMP-forming)/AMP-acid ligase II
MLQRTRTYAELYHGFQWRIPALYNIGVDVIDRHIAEGHGGRVALIDETDDGTPARRYTFADIRASSARLANALRGLGIGRGDRVGILLSQGPQTAIAHVAAYKLGAVALPLFTLFGPEALQYRLSNSGAAVVITNTENVEKVMALRDELPALKEVIVTTPRARCTRTGCCRAICRASRCRTTFSLSPRTCSGRPRIGLGSAGCWMCFCRRGITARRYLPIAPASSTPNMRSP